uniref:Macro domain-containing protein n=1 Tax=Gossypium raimondii TaxID=29730 RepID=A0A0D2UWD2_GOSRA|nr:hypothetical protein B456_011G208100 [Gossypium raimondii]
MVITQKNTSLMIKKTSERDKFEVVGFSRMASATGGKEGEEVGNIFKLSETTVLKIQKGDITLWFLNGSSDAILYIEQLDQNWLKHAIKSQKLNLMFVVPLEKQGLPRFKLPASHVIHTVGPIYDSDKDPKASLTSAHKNCLSVAKENNIEYIAFTAISCGVYGYPFEEAATIAISTVKNFADGIKELH